MSEQEFYVAEVDFEEAKQTADLMSLFQDLAFTIDALDRLDQLVNEASEDQILTSSLWVAALISYARCFSTGKRFGLSQDLFEDIEGGVECHQLYIDLRNKHIAHSVNPFEQVVVGLILSHPSSDDREVEGVSILSQRLLHFTSEGIRNLRRLALFAMKAIERQGKEFRRRTLETGKRMSIDALYEKATARIVTPGPRDAGRPRK